MSRVVEKGCVLVCQILNVILAECKEMGIMEGIDEIKHYSDVGTHYRACRMSGQAALIWPGTFPQLRTCT
eukprot:8996763-Prorocentrum_lima.AAC.1